MNFILILLISINANAVSEKLLNCIVQVESGGVINVISKTGDYGLGQINKKAWPDIDHDRLLTDRAYSLGQTRAILSYYRSKLSKDSKDLNWVCSYNIGLTAYRQNKKRISCAQYNRKVFKCLNLK